MNEHAGYAKHLCRRKLQFISETFYREDAPGFPRISLDLLAQQMHVLLNVTHSGPIGSSPNMLDDLFTGENASDIRGEQAEKLVFLGSQFDLPVSYDHLFGSVIDIKVHMICSWSRKTAWGWEHRSRSVILKNACFDIEMT